MAREANGGFGPDTAKPGGLAGALLAAMLMLPATAEAAEPSAPVVSQRNVSLALANDLAGATLEACHRAGRGRGGG